MLYSDKLNGFWEEGYHFCMEIRDDRLTVRDYRRKVMLETIISYDADRIERGERTVLKLSDIALSKNLSGGIMWGAKELAWDGGELFLTVEDYVPSEKVYTLKKVDRGPFDHILIRDEEILPKLEGRWVQWKENGEGEPLTITGNILNWGGFGGGAVHAVSYKTNPQRVYLVPEDLTDENFSGFSRVEVVLSGDHPMLPEKVENCPIMLFTRLLITDMSVPLSVFARPEDVKTIPVPPEAREKPVNSMTARPFFPEASVLHPEISMNGPLGTYVGINKGIQQTSTYRKGAAFCASCGWGFRDGSPRFCPECGAKEGERENVFCPVCGAKTYGGKFCSECGCKL